MRYMDMKPMMRKGLVELLTQGVGELNGRSLQQTSALETLGVVAIRMLVAAELIQLPELIEEACEIAAKRDLPVSEAALRESLEKAYAGEEHLARAGCTFHTLQ